MTLRKAVNPYTPSLFDELDATGGSPEAKAAQAPAPLKARSDAPAKTEKTAEAAGNRPGSALPQAKAAEALEPTAPKAPSKPRMHPAAAAFWGLPASRRAEAFSNDEAPRPAPGNPASIRMCMVSDDAARTPPQDRQAAREPLCGNLREKAAELFRQGAGYKSVAASLGVAVSTARDWGRAFRRGTFAAVPRKPSGRSAYTEREREEAMALRKAGMSWTEFEEKTGISRVTCIRWLKEAEGGDAQQPDSEICSRSPQLRLN